MRIMKREKQFRIMRKKKRDGNKRLTTLNNLSKILGLLIPLNILRRNFKV